jgi:hypothetical protein
MNQGAYAKALGKYEQMSKTADRFASNPIVIAKAINRAVRARRPSARYVAPFSTSFFLAFKAVMPTRMWDWAMRKVAFLTPKHLDLGATPSVPVVDRSHGRPANNAQATAN